ncbi:unnamed protein product [Vitrella brassicaformis CCMP3155]|uniref:Uncharacterized protein n=2 Tax=Vitrella brassicaformis TaxID=1169539 RepID=A0A0G4EYP8_VITBC|nr:unnamed protein product [Vitrella brassicaformis CCMP3155]|eukprot:CEM04489.1 unnamed protein product [Vitrella brassicaformis CCMP3155]
MAGAGEPNTKKVSAWMSRYKKNNAVLDTLTEQVERLRTQVHKMEREVLAGETEYGREVNLILQDLKRRSEEAREQLQIEKEKNTAVARQVAEGRKAKLSLQKQWESLEVDYAKKRGLYEKRVQEKEALDKQIEALSHKLENLALQKAKCQAELAQLREDRQLEQSFLDVRNTEIRLLSDTLTSTQHASTLHNVRHPLHLDPALTDAYEHNMHLPPPASHHHQQGDDHIDPEHIDLDDESACDDDDHDSGIPHAVGAPSGPLDTIPELSEDPSNTVTPARHTPADRLLLPPAGSLSLMRQQGVGQDMAAVGTPPAPVLMMCEGGVGCSGSNEVEDGSNEAVQGESPECVDLGSPVPPEVSAMPTHMPGEMAIGAQQAGGVGGGQGARREVQMQ